VTCGALITAGTIGWISHLSMTCGGADSYGYVSASERLLAGTIVQNEPLAEILPANGIRAATPLGYVPSGRIPNTSVPAYPLGLPAVMAIATTFFGRSGAFYVAPLCGLVLLAASYVITRAWYGDRKTALLAGALLAVNPLVFTYSIQAMSDVPAAAALMVAVAALSTTRPLPLLAGIAAAVALITRPALAPAAILLAALPLIARGRKAGSITLWYLAPVTAGVFIQGWTQWYLYGDASASGYGRIAGLYSIDTAWLNTRSYLYWGYLALGPVWLAAVVFGTVTSKTVPRASLALVALGVITPYLFYRPYDHWETLRFLLPVIVIATIIAATGLVEVARRLAGVVAGSMVASSVAAAIAWSWMSWLAVNQVFAMPAHETRHRLVGELVAQVTPTNAVVLALQHSGSLRYYAGRQTVNWDQIPAGQFEDSVKALAAEGFPVFVVIDSAEEKAIFQARHGSVLTTGHWLSSGQRRNVQLFEAPRK
jgi:4-amino-4-deoxy-L-arabinose transferase-like glycosyltransferase